MRVWVSFYGNPEYTAEFSSITLQKNVYDHCKDPNNTSFMFVLPDWRIAPWYSLLDQL